MRARGGGALQRAGEPAIGGHTLAGPECARGPVEADRLARDHELPQREAGCKRPAGPHAHGASHAERDQLVQDDRGRGAAHARGLDRERLAVRARGAGVAPKAAMVVEHARLCDQDLRERERAPGIARQQHALGQRGGGAQVDRRRPGPLERNSGIGRLSGLGLRHGPRL